MPRFVFTSLLLAMTVSGAQAASLKENNLHQLLNKVARESSAGTPRAMNSYILDRGFSVEGTELINHLSVQPIQAEQMRHNSGQMRSQLASSVCNNDGFRQLLDKGATLRYEFTEYQTEKAITKERFTRADCPQ